MFAIKAIDKRAPLLRCKYMVAMHIKTQKIGSASLVKIKKMESPIGLLFLLSQSTTSPFSMLNKIYVAIIDRQTIIGKENLLFLTNVFITIRIL